MTLKIACLSLVCACTLASLTVQAQVPAAKTNAPVRTSTNQPPNAVTNKVTLPQEPGPDFTNSIDMELIKVPGGYWAGKYEVTQKDIRRSWAQTPAPSSAAITRWTV